MQNCRALFNLTSFAHSLPSGELTFTAELNPALVTNVHTLCEQAELLSTACQALHISDSAFAGTHFPALAAAGLLQNRNFEPIVQLSCRDKSIAVLDLEVQAALDMGVNALILVRGEVGALSDESDKRVKVKTTELIRLAQQTGEARKCPDLMLGAIATAFRPEPDWQPKALLAKTAAGANFLRTQICFDTELLQMYIRALTRAKVTWDAAVLAQVAVLPSANAARWLNSNLRGSIMPESVVYRLEQAVDPQAEGVKIAVELIETLRDMPGVAGVSMMTPGDPALILEVVDQCRAES